LGVRAGSRDDDDDDDDERADVVIVGGGISGRTPRGGRAEVPLAHAAIERWAILSDELEAIA
jgi:hypothetical protein